MKKPIICSLLSPLLGLTVASVKDKQLGQECSFEDIPLHGEVTFVEYRGQADLSARFVNAYPDVKVQFVHAFPDDRGQWQVVEFGEDFSVYIDKYHGDLKIQLVNNYPGMRNETILE